jgi:hypothetical protein
MNSLAVNCNNKNNLKCFNRSNAVENTKPYYNKAMNRFNNNNLNDGYTNLSNGKSDHLIKSSNICNKNEIANSK